ARVRRQRLLRPGHGLLRQRLHVPPQRHRPGAGDGPDLSGGAHDVPQPGLARAAVERHRGAHPGEVTGRARRQGETMADTESRVTIHMAASLDGFIARKDGSVDWLETADEFAGGDTLDPGFV